MDKEVFPASEENGPVKKESFFSRRSFMRAGFFSLLAGGTATTVANVPLSNIASNIDRFTKCKGIPKTFTEEQKENPEVNTEEDYLCFLAQSLDTPETLHAFFTKRFIYRDDRDVYSNHTFLEHPLRHGYGTDRWPTPQETINTREFDPTTQEQKMIADCAGVTFLSQEIHKRQDKTSHAISFKGTPKSDGKFTQGHTADVWMETNEHGNYDVYSLDERGVRKNGNTLDVNDNKQGYRTLAEAGRVMWNDLRLVDCAHPEEFNRMLIPINRLLPGGMHTRDLITIEAFNPQPIRSPSALDVGFATVGVAILGKLSQFLKRRKK
jgi:hypothetical protein